MGEVRYAQSRDGTHVAYRVVGGDRQGHEPVVMVCGAFFPIEVLPDDRIAARLLDGLAAIGPLVIFDRRGIGLSDPLDWERPVFEQWCDDLAAVMGAAGIDRATLFGWETGGAVALRFAAREPDRVSSLVVFHAVALDEHDRAAWSTQMERRLQAAVRGEGDLAGHVAPSRHDDPTFGPWIERAGRLGASPAVAARLWTAILREPIDGELLAAISAPTLVLQRPANAVIPAACAAFISAHVRGSRVVDLSGADVHPVAGDIDELLAAVTEFVTGRRSALPTERGLAAVLYTDLAGSTERLARLGDDVWRGVLDRHDAVSQRVVDRHGGHVVKVTGDGILATLPTARAALHAARALRAELASLGLELKVGVHVGEVDYRGDDVSGLAIHLAARVLGAAAPGEILASASVPLAAAGAGFTFTSRGSVPLRGLPGTWELFALDA